MNDSIVESLRKLTHIRSVSPSSLVNRPSFWTRCDVVHPKWWYDKNEPYDHDPFIYVDGIVSAAKWNCWRTYTQTENGNVCIWLGFALTRGTWTEHSWCVLGSKVIETEDAHDIYILRSRIVSRRV